MKLHSLIPGQSKPLQVAEFAIDDEGKAVLVSWRSRSMPALRNRILNTTTGTMMQRLRAAVASSSSLYIDPGAA